MSICAANTLECNGIVYFCDNIRDLVLAVIGSFRVYIAWMVGGLVECMLGMMGLEICSSSPLGLTATWVFFGIVNDFCCTKPLEVMALFFSWPPLEVGVGYRTGATACLGMTGVGCVNTLCTSGDKYSTVCQIAKIVRTASIAANCELHMIVGTSLIASDKKYMAWFIMSSAVTWGCVIYSCKYSSVSVIINDLVLLLIYWMQR